jgi:hypothetical protein
MALAGELQQMRLEPSGREERLSREKENAFFLCFVFLNKKKKVFWKAVSSARFAAN